MSRVFNIRGQGPRSGGRSITTTTVVRDAHAASGGSSAWAATQCWGATRPVFAVVLGTGSYRRRTSTLRPLQPRAPRLGSCTQMTMGGRVSGTPVLHGAPSLGGVRATIRAVGELTTVGSPKKPNSRPMTAVTAETSAAISPSRRRDGGTGPGPGSGTGQGQDRDQGLDRGLGRVQGRVLGDFRGPVPGVKAPSAALVAGQVPASACHRRADFLHSQNGSLRLADHVHRRNCFRGPNRSR